MNIEKETERVVNSGNIPSTETKPGCGQLLFWWVFHTVLGTMTKAWCLSVIWVWFMTPLGLPIINLWHAMGLSVLFDLFMSYVSKSGTKAFETRDGLRSWALLSVIYPLISLGMAWVFHSLM